MDPIAIISKEYPKVVIPLLEKATVDIRIVIYDWRWYDTVHGSEISRFNRTIAACARRSVNIRALVSSEMVSSRLKALGCEARIVHSKKLLHAKLLIIDGKTIVLGSHNFTQNAFSLNHEVSVAFSLAQADNDFVKYFDNLWGL